MMTATVPPTLRSFVRPCRGCGRPILWTTTVRDRRLPVDPVPDPAGNQAVYRDGLGVWRSRVPTRELPVAPFEQLHMPHMATCTDTPVARAKARNTGIADGSILDLAAARRRRRPQPPLLEI